MHQDLPPRAVNWLRAHLRRDFFKTDQFLARELAERFKLQQKGLTQLVREYRNRLRRTHQKERANVRQSAHSGRHSRARRIAAISDLMVGLGVLSLFSYIFKQPGTRTLMFQKPKNKKGKGRTRKAGSRG